MSDWYHYIRVIYWCFVATARTRERLTRRRTFAFICMSTYSAEVSVVERITKLSYCRKPSQLLRLRTTFPGTNRSRR
jgi:hypothetical protein